MNFVFDRVGERNLCLLYQIKHLMLVFVEEWRNAYKHLIQQNTQGPNVNCVIMTFGTKHFWSNVFRSSAKTGSLLIFGDFSSKTKVCQLQIAITIEKHIFWLQVSINDILVMQMPQSNSYLSNHEFSLLFREPSKFH